MAEVFIGQVMPVAFNFAPRNFAHCDGQLMAIAQNQALFALLGTQYGGNGTTTFGLPDLRGRTPVHRSPTVPIGQAGGREAVALSVAEMPLHDHRAAGTSAGGSLQNPTGGRYGAADENLYATPGAQVALDPQTVATTGSSQPHNNMQPYSALNFCIALSGIFPSRQ